LEDLLEVAVPGKFVVTPDGAHRIAVDFAEECQGSVENFLRIKRLIEARYAGAAVGIRLDIGSGSVAIPMDSNRIWVLYSAAESLRIPDWIEVVRADDFRFCPNLHEISAGLQRESAGVRNCQKLEHGEISRSVEVAGRSGFRTSGHGNGKGMRRGERAGRFS
jgi:hypothetical protein